MREKDAQKIKRRDLKHCLGKKPENSQKKPKVLVQLTFPFIFLDLSDFDIKNVETN